MDPMVGEEGPRAGTRWGGQGAEAPCPRPGAGGGIPPVVWSPALWGRGRSPMAASRSSLPWSGPATRARQFRCQDHHLLSSSPHSESCPHWARQGARRATLAGPGGGVCLSGPLGRRGDGGTDSSGFSSSPPGASLALTPTGGHWGCKALEGGLFGSLGPL